MNGGLWITTDTAEIDRLVGDVELACRELERASWHLLQARALLPVVLGLGGERAAAIGAITGALTSCEALLARLAARATALREAARGYEAAESGALAVVADALGVPTGWSLLPSPAVLGFGIGNAVTGGSFLPGWLVQRYAAESPIDELARALETLRPTAQTLTESELAARVAPGLAAVAGLIVRPSDPVAVAQSAIELDDGAPSAGTAAAGGVEHLAQRIQIAYEASGEGESAVDVQAVEHQDGTRSWTVAVPGTMGGIGDMGPGGMPFSAESNVPAFLGMSTAGDALIVAAMLRAGVRPGEKVVLAGHSQGGMAVTRVAGDPALQGVFTFAAVVTFGSPVAHMRPTGIPTMNLQHAEDGIAALSGRMGARPGGPAEKEVVVVRELVADGTATAGLSPHDMSVYEETARRVEEEGSPATGDWELATKDLWAQPGDDVTATTYRGSRS